MNKNSNYQYTSKTYSNKIQEDIDNLKKYSFTVVLDLEGYKLEDLEKLKLSLDKQWIKNFNLIVLEKNKKTFEDYNEIIENEKNDYIIFLKEYEYIENSFFYEVLKAINTQEYDLIYTNEDFIKNNQFIDVRYKSNISKQLIYSFNYIGKSLILKTSFLKKIKGFEAYNSTESLFYDLVLKAIESTKNIHFIDSVCFIKI
ncbi:hypothetical protein ACMC56_12140 [Campylobacterota bacterium DY0563]